jgi:hypothetical protein
MANADLRLEKDIGGSDLLPDPPSKDYTQL